MSGLLGVRKVSASSDTGAAHAASSAAQPRGSTSSSRSRPTAEDFEAALREPQRTLFLSSTPQHVIDEYGSPAGSSTGTIGGPAGSGGDAAAPLPVVMNTDRPEPIAKRSFDEDLRRLQNVRRPSVQQQTPTKNATTTTTTGGVPTFAAGVIPPTPSPAGSVMGRRESVATTGSAGSSPAANRAQRYRGQAVGIEDEVASMSKSVKKRRSLFRSAGTASNSDLSKTVRTAAPPLPAIPSVPPARSAASSGGGSQMPSSSSRPALASISSSGETASRVSSGRTAAWAGTQSSMPEHKRQPSDEGFKTMKNKAKGMFGRMFGASREPSMSRSPHSSPSISSIPQLGTPITTSPRFGSPGTHSDIFAMGSSAASASGSTPRTTAEAAFSNLAISDGRRSVTPTARSGPVPSGLGSVGGVQAGADGDRLRAVSGESRASTGSDKPLPPIRPDTGGNVGLSDPFATVGRSSHHTRQPAFAFPEPESPTTNRPAADRGRIPSFSEDVGDALASIGHEPLAQGLGLPPEAVRRDDSIGKSRPKDKENGNTIRRLPSDLSHSSSQGPAHSPVLAQRSSSLPSQGLSQEDSGSSIAQQLAAAAVARPTSRTSQRSTSPTPVRKTSTTQTQQASATDPLNDFGPPMLAVTGPDSTDADDEAAGTIRAAKHDTIRLVPSPVIDTGSSSSNILDLSHEYPSVTAVAQASSRPLAMRTASAVSNVTESDGEDEEEKGRRLACEFLEGNYEHMSSAKVAMFLGGPRPVNSYALRYYMQYFDMKGQNLVESFRDLCAKLHLKAESQEIDRIIEGFSARYYECNPDTIFGSPGVVHTVTAAMLMLNTDLHVADLSKHMSRADFVRNAMRAIQESMPDGPSQSEILREDSADFDADSAFGTPTKSVRSPAPSTTGSGQQTHPPAHRSASAPLPSQPAALTRMTSEAAFGSDGKSRSISNSHGSMYSRAWEAEAENVLKEIYAAVRSERILLPTASAAQSNRQSMISLATSDRNRSMRSPSDRINALKRGSVRMPNYLDNNPYGNNFSSSSTGRLSPTGSYATSINETMNQSLGFASNLSHAVIREHEDETRSIHSAASLSSLDDMDDDELALLGAPWAKEGLLWHKLFMEAAGKRPKKPEWKQYFSVVSTGQLYMFVFGQSGGGGGSFMMGGGGGAVGGGNWLQNAKPTGTVDLMHSVAAPAPKGSVDRPHCFRLIASSGSVTLFQAGTDDLVAEWVATCNYWAARRSRQPLSGGVSNMEYGWQKVQGPSQHPQDDDDRASVRSGRSNVSKMGAYGRKALLPSDRMHINDWRPPPPAMMPSPLDEETQLDTLQVYVHSLRRELDEHKALEEPMNRQYAPGSKNGTKAKENFKAKTAYLSGEIAKYNTYVESLRSAIALRLKKAGERRLEKSLMRSAASLHRRESDYQVDGGNGSGAAAMSRDSTVAAHKNDDDEDEQAEQDAALELIRGQEVRVDPTVGDDLFRDGDDLGQGGGTIRASRAR